jgi:hypothetical protein
MNKSCACQNWIIIFIGAAIFILNYVALLRYDKVPMKQLREYQREIESLEEELKESYSRNVDLLKVITQLRKHGS